MKVQPIKCDLCGSTAIDHNELMCSFNRQVKANVRNKETDVCLVLETIRRSKENIALVVCKCPKCTVYC